MRWFREQGMPTERLHLAGLHDEGDLAVTDADLTYLVEAKAERQIALSSYVNEAVIERDNYCKARGLDRSTVLPLAIVKRRSLPLEQAYVVTTVAEFFGGEL